MTIEVCGPRLIARYQGQEFERVNQQQTVLTESEKYRSQVRTKTMTNTAKKIKTEIDPSGLRYRVVVTDLEAEC